MLLWPVVIVVGFYLLLALALFLFQSRMIFIPITDLMITPGQAGLDYEDVVIPVSDGAAIHGWYFRSAADSPQTSLKVVMLCHGNAGNISHRLETAEFIMHQGADILLWDYRGYGRSTGSPTEQNLYDDADACFNWLQSDKGFRPQDIIIFGRSLGGAVAIDLARRERSGGLVVESAFTTAADMGHKVFPFLPVRWLLRFKFNSIDKIGDVNVPIVVAHSPNDEIVPYKMGRALFEAATAPKRFVKLSGGHNERHYFSDPAYIAAWRDMLAGGI